MITEELENAREEGEMRGVIWNGLGYANWQPIVTLGPAMKASLSREIRYKTCANGAIDPSSEDGRDVAGSRYGTTATVEILQGGQNWRQWGVQGVPRKRREAVVSQISGHFWREEAVSKEGGWKKVLHPLWREINRKGGATEREQQKFLRCFEKLDAKEADQFVRLFRQGPAIEPEWVPMRTVRWKKGSEQEGGGGRGKTLPACN